jgi:shikimate kinase
MGAGKSKLGKKLAVKLNIPFFDSDSLIEEIEKLSIDQLFKSKGEAYFRMMEKKVIDDFQTKDDFVLSVGGGLPCQGNLMNDLNHLGTTIYLKHSSGILHQRLRNNKLNRPLLLDLSDEEMKAFIENKLAEREAFYMKSKLVLKTEDQSVNEIIRQYHLLQKN